MRRTRATLTALCLLLPALLLPAPAAARVPAGPPVAQTSEGTLRGVRGGTVEQFLGVRYAAPPRRWELPRAPEQWSGVRAADRHGNPCPAPETPFGPGSVTEDCLFLDVVRPAGTRPGERRPVYFWIHGGSFVLGSAEPYDGTQLARETGAVVVSINYRLGVLGFLTLPSLGEPGNYGFADQQAALRWVHRNIAEFGGDPRAVTIAGESAGGWSVCGHLASPGSRGLYARAVVQSGACVSQTADQAEAVGAQIAADAGCGAPDPLPCLREAGTGTLVGASPVLMLLVDSATFTAPPAEAVREGRFTRVPVLLGATRDEARSFTVDYIGWTRERYVAWLRETFAADADAVYARYPWPASGADRFTPAYLAGAIATDAGFLAGIGGCPQRRLGHDFARYTRTYVYRFDHRTGPGPAAEPAGYVWGAGHVAELGYFWPTFGIGAPMRDRFGPAERRLSREMTRYWSAFVRTGTPQVPGQRYWPRHDRGHPVLSLRPGITVLRDAAVAREHMCAFWDGDRPPGKA
jgi:carboxylesterase type B